MGYSGVPLGLLKRMIDPGNGVDMDEPAHADFAGRTANPQLSPRFVAVSRSLQRIFGKVVEQPLPERLRNLIEQVERAGHKRH